MTPYPSYTTLDLEHEGRLLTIRLNRPKVHNAVGDGMHEELEELFGLIGEDASVGAVLLCGAGRSFCAGADVKELVEPAADEGGDVGRVDRMTDMSRRLVRNILRVEQPIVAAVHGYALGMGANLALFCDIVFAADDAVFADNHVAVGLAAGDGGTVMWPLLLPINTAKYYLLTGDRIDGATAERLGLVQRVLPRSELLTEARAVARRLAHGATLAIKHTKRAANKIIQERVDLTLDGALVGEGLTFMSRDHQEAARALVEKREPVFRGY